MLNLSPLRLDITATRNAALLDMLRPGQVLPGRILPPGPDGMPRLQVAGQTIGANLAGVPAGTPVTVTVEAGPQGLRLLVSPQPAGAAPPFSLPAGGPGTGATSPAPPPTLSRPLADIIPRALANQDSLAPLLARLTSLAPALDRLPPSLARPVLALLSAAIDLDGSPLDGKTLQQAVSRSGIFLEARLATGAAPAQGDAKAALLALRSLLAGFTPPHLPAAPSRQVPAPPLRHGPLRAETLDLSAPPAAVSGTRDLAGDADAALDRLRLLQFASLPDSDPTITRSRLEVPPRWDLELPFVLGNELALARLQVDEDATTDSENPGSRWRVRFALAFAAIGEVGAEITLVGKRVGVGIWSDRDDTRDWLADNLAELRTILAASGLEPGHLAVRPPPVADQPPPSGSLSDRHA